MTNDELIELVGRAIEACPNDRGCMAVAAITAIREALKPTAFIYELQNLTYPELGPVQRLCWKRENITAQNYCWTETALFAWPEVKL